MARGVCAAESAVAICALTFYTVSDLLCHMKPAPIQSIDPIAPRVKLTKIEPYYDAFDKHAAFDDLGFEFVDCTLVRQPDRWLRLTLNWKAVKDEWKFKNVTFSGSSSGRGGGYSDEGVCLEFHMFEMKNNPRLEVGLSAPGYLRNPLDNYLYRFFENLKYGVSIYFSPRRKGGVDKVLWDWTATHTT